MKLIMYRIFLVMCFCGVTIGCEDDFENIGEEYYPTEIEYGNRPLGLGSTSVSIDGFGAIFYCTVYANEQQPWQITELPSWLTVNKMQVVGNDMITFSAKENPSESADRSARLYIESTLKDFPLKIAYDVHQRARPKVVAVDLGLSVKWATFNVGANKPEEYGEYYAWGEIEQKGNYEWDTYYYWHNDLGFFKYCTDSHSGTVDNRIVLYPGDDVAHVKWGGNWRMPTSDEIEELVHSCTWKWTTYNGVNGMKVIGSNGNSIFLPAAGYRESLSFSSRGSCGNYWSNTLVDNINDLACGLRFNISNHEYWPGSNRRFIGQTIRPVTD